jgi:rhodanese-related sulfurtransferase
MSELGFEISVAETKSLLDSEADFYFMDCREQNEWDYVMIEGAELLPMSEIQDRIDELEPQKERHIVIHCHHGGRSLQVAQWLRQQGFAQAQSMAGGIDVWSQEIDDSKPRYS